MIVRAISELGSDPTVDGHQTEQEWTYSVTTYNQKRLLPAFRRTSDVILRWNNIILPSNPAVYSALRLGFPKFIDTPYLLHSVLSTQYTFMYVLMVLHVRTTHNKSNYTGNTVFV